MTKHTPGPWKYNPKSGWITSDYCCERGPMHIADIRGWGHLTGHGHGAHAMPWLDATIIQEANANIIISAPEMLALLIESQTGIGGDWRERRDAIVAKARGLEE